MKYEYKKIDSEKKGGLQRVEQLVSKGWKIISYGFWEIILEKKIFNSSKVYFDSFVGDENDCSEGYGFAGI